MKSAVRKKRASVGAGSHALSAPLPCMEGNLFISVKAVSWVFEQSKTKGLDRFVLLAIATHANEDGVAWPSLDTLQRLTGISRPTLLRAIKRLEEANGIVVDRGGSGPGDTNRYMFTELLEQLRRVKSLKKGNAKGKDSTLKRVTRALPEEVVLEDRKIEEESSPPALMFPKPVKQPKVRSYPQRQFVRREDGSRQAGERVQFKSADERRREHNEKVFAEAKRVHGISD